MKYCIIENGCIVCDYETCDRQNYNPQYKTVKEAKEKEINNE